MSVVAKAMSLLGRGSSSRSIGPIGIDFGLEALHLVQLAFSDGKRRIVWARASIPYGGSRDEVLASPHQFRSLMKRALDADRFSGRKAVIAVPTGMFKTVSINYRYTGGKDEEAAAVLRAMKDRLDGDLTEYVLDYLPVTGRRKKDEHLALAAVSDRKSIVEFLELARKSRLEVEALEIGPVAISRLVRTMSLASGSINVLIINSGRAASYLTVISGDDLLFDQEVAFGEESLIRQAAKTLDMSEAMARDLIVRSSPQPAQPGRDVSGSIDAASIESTISQILKPQFLGFVEEIKRVCLYAASETRGGAVSQVYLLGSLAHWPGSHTLLGKLAGLEVTKIPDPLALFRPNDGDNDSARKSAPEITVATGAALRGLRADG